jgi:hypothetical protein
MTSPTPPDVAKDKHPLPWKTIPLPTIEKVFNVVDANGNCVIKWIEDSEATRIVAAVNATQSLQVELQNEICFAIDAASNATADEDMKEYYAALKQRVTAASAKD